MSSPVCHSDETEITACVRCEHGLASGMAGQASPLECTRVIDFRLRRPTSRLPRSGTRTLLGVLGFSNPLFYCNRSKTTGIRLRFVPAPWKLCSGVPRGHSMRQVKKRSHWLGDNWRHPAQITQRGPPHRRRVEARCESLVHFCSIPQQMLRSRPLKPLNRRGCAASGNDISRPRPCSRTQHLGDRPRASERNRVENKRRISQMLI